MGNYCSDCGGALLAGAEKCACGWTAKKTKAGKVYECRPWHIVEMPWREILIQKKIRELNLERRPGEDRDKWIKSLIEVMREAVPRIGSGGNFVTQKRQSEDDQVNAYLEAHADHAERVKA